MFQPHDVVKSASGPDETPHMVRMAQGRQVTALCDKKIEVAVLASGEICSRCFHLWQVETPAPARGGSDGRP